MRNYYSDDRGGGRSFGGRGGGGRGFGGGGFGGGRDFNRDRGGFGRGDRPMFKAICSNCGKECEVPFKPTGAKPVYCSECFEKRSRDVGHTNFPRDSRGGDQSQSIDLSGLNAKLDKILAILEPKTPIITPKIEEAKGPELVERVEEKPKKKPVKKSTSTKKESLDK